MTAPLGNLLWSIPGALLLAAVWLATGWTVWQAVRLSTHTAPGASAAPSATGRLDLVGQVGGVTFDAVAVGDTAYVGVGPRVVAYDIARPTAPRRVGESAILGGIVLDIAVAGKLGAVATGEGGIDLLGLDDASAPRLVGRVATLAEANSVAVDAGLVCAAVASEVPALWIIDALDPARPRVAARIELPAEAYGLEIWERRLFFMVADEGLRVVDLTRLDRPREIGRLAIPDSLGGSDGRISIDSGFAFIADGPNGLFVVDVVDPAAPRMVGHLAETDNARGVFATGGYAFVADGPNGLATVDVSTPGVPRLVGRLATDGASENAWAVGEHLLVAEGRGARIVDAQAPETLRPVSALDGPAYITAVASAGNAAFAFDTAQSRLWSVDIGLPRAARVLDFAAAPVAANEAGSVGVADGNAYVANGQQGILIFDVKNASDIDDVGVFAQVTALDLSVAGGRVDVASGGDGLHMVDMSDPARPALHGSYLPGEAATAVFAQPDRAFVFGGGVLHILDSRDPKAPRLLVSHPLGDDVNEGVVVADHALAYVATDRLHVLDLADVARPLDLGTWEPSENRLVAPQIGVEGSGVFVSDYATNELWAVDVSSPENATEVAHARLPFGGRALDLAVRTVAGDGVYALVAAGDSGLAIFRYSELAGGSLGTLYLPMVRNR
jgi:hypothetical protein